MPRTLKFLCLILGALLVADIVMLALDAIGTQESDPLLRKVLIGANAIGAAIAVLLLVLLVAFMKRVRNAMVWLHTFVVVNAVLLGGTMLWADHLFEAQSLFDSVENLRVWLEILACCALALVLRSEKAKNWYEQAEVRSVAGSTS